MKRWLPWAAAELRTAWQFPLRQPGLQLSSKQIIDGWDQFHGGRGLVDLEAHLVRQVRVWRPEVIVTRAADARDGDAADGLIAQAVWNAVHKAADANEFAGQITQAGLGPWRVKKVYASLAQGNRGSLDLITAQLAPRLGRALADVAGPARGLLDDRFHAVPATLGFRAISDPLQPGGGQGDFFAGIALPARQRGPPAVGRRAAGGHRTAPSCCRAATFCADHAGSGRTRPAGGRPAAGRDGRLDPRPGRRQRGGNHLSSGRRLCAQRAGRPGGRGISIVGRSISRRSALPAGLDLAGAILRQRRTGRADARCFRARRRREAQRPAGAGRGPGRPDRADPAGLVCPAGGVLSSGGRISQAGIARPGPTDLLDAEPQRGPGGMAGLCPWRDLAGGEKRAVA